MFFKKTGIMKIIIENVLICIVSIVVYTVVRFLIPTMELNYWIDLLLMVICYLIGSFMYDLAKDRV